MTTWIRSIFSPEHLEQMVFSKHLDFYYGGAIMFGMLDPEPLDILIDEDLHVEAHFVGVDIDRSGEIDPTNITVVELDVDPDDPRYLARGMGIGALVCETQEPDGSQLILPISIPQLDAGDAAAIPDSPAGRLFSSWLAAHNRGDRDSLVAWVESSYSAESLQASDVSKRLGWYLDGVEMFGRLNPRPIKITASSEFHLEVQLVAATVSTTETIDPGDVLVVEVDVNPDQPTYLARGLGFGPLK